eukprot:7376175-Prymnesium_polylepis.2
MEHVLIARFGKVYRREVEEGGYQSKHHEKSLKEGYVVEEAYIKPSLPVTFPRPGPLSRAAYLSFVLLSLLPLTIPATLGLGYLPMGLLFLAGVKATYVGGAALVASFASGCLSNCTYLQPPKPVFKICFSWLSSVANFKILDGAAGKRIGDASLLETSSESLAGGLACWVLILGLAPCVVYSTWASVAPVNALEAFGVAYTSLLALKLDWWRLLPSFAKIRAIIDDPEGVITDLLQHLSNALAFVNFDPSYYMQGMTSLDAFNAVLALLRLLAVYGRKAFAALDTLRTLLQGNEGASDGTVSVAN